MNERAKVTVHEEPNGKYKIHAYSPYGWFQMKNDIVRSTLAGAVITAGSLCAKLGVSPFEVQW